MRDSHCHIPSGADGHDLCATRPSDFATVESLAKEGDTVSFGVHPWYADEFDEALLREFLLKHPDAGVGEIGLDRLKTKTVSEIQRTVFLKQLEIAAEMSRPVTLHGAKCWGEVVKAVRPFAGRIPRLLFHGFSRSEGLLGEIFAMNGYVSVGPALLNDHAVNYRAMVARLPRERVLFETDATAESGVKFSIGDIVNEYEKLCDERRRI